MQAYCQLARQGLGLMIFLLSGGRGRSGRGDRKPCQDVLCSVVYFTGNILYYIILYSFTVLPPPLTTITIYNITSPLPPYIILSYKISQFVLILLKATK